MREHIEGKLRAALSPIHLEVVNESHLHSVPPGSETHFKVLVVSQALEGLGLVDRHRRVNEALRDELKGGLHALGIRALSPAEWQASSAAAFVSPPCLGGSKAEG